MSDKMSSYTLEPVGFIRSTLKRREEAPRQGPEGAPDAWLEIEPQFAEALLEMEVGHELIVITWLHEPRRDVLKGHQRSDESRERNVRSRMPVWLGLLHAFTGATEPARAASRDGA